MIPVSCHLDWQCRLPAGRTMVLATTSMCYFDPEALVEVTDRKLNPPAPSSKIQAAGPNTGAN